MFLLCHDWRKRQRKDHPVPYAEALVKTGS